MSALISPSSVRLLDLRDHGTLRTASYTVAAEGYGGRPTDVGALHRCITALKVWDSDLDVPDWAGLTAVHRLARHAGDFVCARMPAHSEE